MCEISQQGTYWLRQESDARTIGRKFESFLDMTKEELEKYARENRKRLDAQEVKLGDVVKLLVRPFAGETGIVVGISACCNDYTDPYYEVDVNCEVPEKYKCRETLITPNNVIGGLNAHDFEVIGNRAPMQPTEEIKVGDKVRVSKDAPEMYFFGCNYDNSVCKVILVDRDNAVITQVKNGSFAIPTKYLIKVDAEAKEPKFKKGDKVLYLGVQYIVEDMSDVDGWKYLISRGCGGFITCVAERFIDPYTEPKAQTEAEKTNPDNLKKIAEEWANEVSNAIEEYGDAMCKIYVEAHNEAYWEAYAADLAKEIALKVANKYSVPKEAADYAVLVAKAVVENLKKK